MFVAGQEMQPKDTDEILFFSSYNISLAPLHNEYAPSPFSFFLHPRLFSPLPQ